VLPAGIVVKENQIAIVDFEQNLFLIALLSTTINTINYVTTHSSNINLPVIFGAAPGLASGSPKHCFSLISLGRYKSTAHLR
jgi:hypothetical protein